MRKKLKKATSRRRQRRVQQVGVEEKTRYNVRSARTPFGCGQSTRQSYTCESTGTFSRAILRSAGVIEFFFNGTRKFTARLYIFFFFFFRYANRNFPKNTRCENVVT